MVKRKPIEKKNEKVKGKVAGLNQENSKKKPEADNIKKEPTIQTVETAEPVVNAVETVTNGTKEQDDEKEFVDDGPAKQPDVEGIPRSESARPPSAKFKKRTPSASKYKFWFPSNQFFKINLVSNTPSVTSLPD